MYEHRSQTLLPLWAFLSRMARHFLLALALLALSLWTGTAGYMHFEHLSGLDAFLNAAMLLGGMGPVNAPVTPAGKLFAGLYALYAGLVFLISAGILFAPALHRLMHRLHLEGKA